MGSFVPIAGALGTVTVEADIPGARWHLVVVVAISAHGVLGEDLGHAVVRLSDVLPEADSGLAITTGTGDVPVK